MPGWLKVLLIVAVIVVLLVGGVVVGGVIWWGRNKDRLVSQIKEVAAEGREFGRNTDNQGCVDETVSRYKKEPGFTAVISNSLFTRACLDASRPTPGFCSDIPKITEFIKSAEWRKSQCSRADLSSDSYCPQMFQPVQEFCERGPRKSTYGDNSNSQ
jgi:hypothetical protein